MKNHWNRNVNQNIVLVSIESLIEIRDEFETKVRVLLEKKDDKVRRTLPIDDSWWIIRSERVYTTSVSNFIQKLKMFMISDRLFTFFSYQFSKKKTIKPEELEKYGVTMKSSGEVTLETEYEKIKKIDIENWENVRGPRPWEEQPVKN